MGELIHEWTGVGRISSSGLELLVGIAMEVAADGRIARNDADLISAWLGGHAGMSDRPMIRTLFGQVGDVLSDRTLDETEYAGLLETLNSVSALGGAWGTPAAEVADLPFCRPVPELDFDSQIYCFLGTFAFGQRRYCEQAVIDLGSTCAPFSRKTDALVIGAYAMADWRQHSLADSVVQAAQWRDAGAPIAIVSETDWAAQL
jgi:hypothetical protein